MQTFVPFTVIDQCAYCLDDLRLGKQIIEGQQIYRALTNPDYGWQHHPAVLMWSGCEPCLLYYIRECAIEWRRRKEKNHGAWLNLINQHLLIEHKLFIEENRFSHKAVPRPFWWGGPIHITHQSNLLRKDSDYYSEFFEGVPDNLPYFWPVSAENFTKNKTS
jgi:hypothetical protein